MWAAFANIFREIGHGRPHVMTRTVSFAPSAPISAVTPRRRTSRASSGSKSHCGRLNPSQHFRTASLTLARVRSPLNEISKCSRPAEQALPSIPSCSPICAFFSVDRCQVKSIIVVFVADILADAVVLDIFERIHEVNDIIRVVVGLLSAYATVDFMSAIFNSLKMKRRTANNTTTRTENILKPSFPKLVAPHCLVSIPSFLTLIALPAGDIMADSFLCYVLTFFALLPAIAKWNITERTFKKLVPLPQGNGTRKKSPRSFLVED